MKKLALSLSLLVFASFAHAGPRSSHFSSCDLFVEEAIVKYDWRTHEDDYNEARILTAKRSVKNRRVYWTYQVVGGLYIAKPSKWNSTYQVVIMEADDCDRTPFCKRLYCQIGHIKEIRKR